MKKLPGILGCVIVVAFFMPWVTITMGGFSVSTAGYKVYEAAALDAKLYLLYLIPICAAVLAFFSFTDNENTSTMSIVAGAVPWAFFLYGLIEAISNGAPMGDLLGILGLGIWLTALAGIGCILVGAGVINTDS